MKRNLSICLFFAVLLSALQAPAPFVAAQKKGVRSKPLLAVLEFKGKADGQWWRRGGAEAMQDVFVTELAKSRKFRVVEREQLQALLRKNNLTLGGMSTARLRSEPENLWASITC